MMETVKAIVVVVFLVVVGTYIIQNAESISVLIQAAVYGSLGAPLMNFNTPVSMQTLTLGLLVALAVLLIIITVANAIQEGGEDED